VGEDVAYRGRVGDEGDEAYLAPTLGTQKRECAVFWIFFGVRKPRRDVARRGHIKPQKVIAVGILLAAIFVFTLVALVRFITPGN
jgi:hypothetical protein